MVEKRSLRAAFSAGDSSGLLSGNFLRGSFCIPNGRPDSTKSALPQSAPVQLYIPRLLFPCGHCLEKGLQGIILNDYDSITEYRKQSSSRGMVSRTHVQG
jgi:hypothetical protein